MQNDTSSSIKTPGLNELIKQSLGYIKDLISLARLEMRLSVQHIAIIFLLTLSAIFLIFGSWLLILAAIVLGLWSYGYPLLTALVIAAGISLLLAIACYLYTRKCFSKIGLPKTFQQLAEVGEQKVNHE